MNNVRKNFDSNEAEIYQQGEKLILRLKNLNFKSGSAQIPTSSMSLLGKVGDITNEIEPDSVQVQGHKGSVGSNSLNQKISIKRAKAVEKFLVAKDARYEIQSVVFGEQKPLASNETKQGRSLNRRVDILIDAK